ncbi:MFS transporter [Aliidiomarina halalkaliphila]|uniref:MFS transporter n=1 Tax=Aliidiomarina halalkaliphila TaxID=2593535 RepID=A0A552X383_9GAMM|nr:MFS transporter [Aliidiomarina halalkaliphila]TRW49491.1 MFS transporter [Aliidiomarina halalkaliphila]
MSPFSAHQDPAFARQCRRLSWSYFGYFAVLALLVPYLAVYLDGLGFDSRQIGELIALATLCRIVGPPVWAGLSDRSGKLLPAIRLGVFASLALLLVMTQLSSYWAVAIGLGLVSFFWSAILPQLEVVTLSSLGAQHQLYSRIRLGGSLGFIVVALFAAELLAWGGYQAYPWLAAALLIPLALMSLRLAEPARDSTPQDEGPSDVFWRRIRRKPFLLFMFSSLCLQMSFAPFYAFFALYLNQLGYAPMAVGALIALGVVAEVGMFMIAGRLLVRFSVSRIIAVCLGITALRWWLLGHVADVILWLLFIQLMHAFSFALHHSAAIRFLHHYFPSSQHSRGQAMYVSIGMGGGGAIGAWLAGLYWQQGDGATTTFMVAAALTFVGMLAALAMPRAPRESLAKGEH